MKASLKIQQKGLLLVLVPLIFELFFVATLVSVQRQAEEAVAREAHSKAVIADVQNLILNFYIATESFVKYCMFRSPVFASQYDEKIGGVPAMMKQLGERISTNDQEQQTNFHEFDVQINKALGLLRDIKSRLDADETIEGRAESLKLHKVIQNQLHSLMHTAMKISQVEEDREKLYPQEQADKRRLVDECVAAGVVVNILMTIALAIYFSGNITTRLWRIVSNAVNIAGGQPLAPPLKGSDEIANLDQVLHEVAAILTEASRRERALVDNVQDAICSLDDKLTLTKASPAASKLWGYEQSELIGTRLSNLIAEEDRPKVIEVMERARTGQPVGTIEARSVRKDGVIVWLLWSLYWSQAEQSFFCVAHDVNERKELEQLKQNFVNMVSHDLRTPLTAVRAFLQTLSVGGYGPMSEKGKSAALRLENSVERLVQLINDLLDVERMNESGIALNTATVNAAEIIDGALDMVSAFAEQQRIEIQVERGETVLMQADSGRLIQVLQNLLSNAIKFSAPNTVVTIASRIIDGEAEISVTDRGPGISDDEQSLVFERFHQLKTRSDAKVKGSGLGLAISKAIVEQHGGSIGVASKIGQGSRFWIRVPAVQNETLSIAPTGVKLL